MLATCRENIECKIVGCEWLPVNLGLFAFSYNKEKYETKVGKNIPETPIFKQGEDTI
jgi:hypothetical protein